MSAKKGHQPHHEMSASAQLLWGAVGGMLPFAIQLIRDGNHLGKDLPAHIGSYYIVSFVLGAVIGAIAGRAFKSHDILVALYHGATAPITLAFVIGFGVH